MKIRFLQPLFSLPLLIFLISPALSFSNVKLLTSDPRTHERKLLSIDDIRSVISAELLPQWECTDQNDQTFVCPNKAVFGGYFVIKFKPRYIPGTQSVKNYALTVTNSMASTGAKVPLTFHGTYQIRLSPETTTQVLQLKVKALLGKAGIENSSASLLMDMKTYGFKSLSQIVSLSQVIDFFAEIITNPVLIKSKTSVFASGSCAGTADLPCSFMIYTIDHSSGGAEITVGSRQIRSLFPSFNFEENFVGFKANLLKEFKEVVAKETEAATLGFPQFQKTISDQLNTFCNGCKSDQSATLNAYLIRLFDVPFQLSFQEEVMEGGQARIEEVPLNSRMIAIYYSLRLAKIAHIWFDNARVSTETILPVDAKSFGTAFLNEGKAFVDLSKSDPATEKEEQVMTIATIKKEFEGLKDKCKEGAIVEPRIQKAIFGFNCAGMTVIRVQEVAVEGTLGYRIDFLYGIDPGEGKPMRSSITLGKVSTRDQFGKVKPDIEAYLSKFME